MQVAPAYADAPGAAAVKASLDVIGSPRPATLCATLVFCSPAHFKVPHPSNLGLSLLYTGMHHPWTFCFRQHSRHNSQGHVMSALDLAWHYCATSCSCLSAPHPLQCLLVLIKQQIPCCNLLTEHVTNKTVRASDLLILFYVLSSLQSSDL